jgi:DNA-binding MurR/RpiR family transcriptional regulator
MSRVSTESELRSLVMQHAADLPVQQRAIADYLLEHLNLVPFLSIPELARRTGASEATVVRFAQRIGFSGFAELKAALVEILQSRIGADPAVQLPDELGENVLDAVATLEIANIESSVASTDRAIFAEIAEALYAADHCFSFGMGVSAHLAELMAYTLIQTGVRATCLSTRFTSPREQVVALRPGDALVVFSFPPYSRQSLEMIEEATRRGAVTVAICDRLTAPAAGLARLALAVKTDNLLFTNAVAAVTVLFNALAAAIATSHRERALAAFAHINRVLEGDASLLPADRQSPRGDPLLP